jgi:phosphoribosylformylglycinamidine synthase
MAAAFQQSNGQKITVKSPGSLVISAYAPCPDITKTITPDIKAGGHSKLLYIDFTFGNKRTGASALSQVFSQIGDVCPDIEDIDLLKRTFNVVQEFIDKGLMLSGHDISDGGLITTLCEMAFAGNCGLEINIDNADKNISALDYLFAEEPGIVIEYMPEKENEIVKSLDSYHIPRLIIGKTLDSADITIVYQNQIVLKEKTAILRAIWEETSFRLESLQANPNCVRQEHISSFRQKPPSYKVTFTPLPTESRIVKAEKKPQAAIIRQEGSNGDREMTSAFYMAGFEPWDVTMTDLINKKVSLEQFRGIVFVGGFSFADVLDSAKGWAGVIKFNDYLLGQFQTFYNREDTFSLGVCNGCQLMALLGWVPWQCENDLAQPRFIHNDSNRFESRFSTVTVLQSPSILLKDMEGSVLGIWAAHGEGKAFFSEKNILEKVLENNLAPLRYVDDENNITTEYPFNPNGSPYGIAGLCTADGRHLAMMPHPERTFLKWQWPWLPKEMNKNLTASPWLKLFQNAYFWCNDK